MTVTKIWRIHIMFNSGSSIDGLVCGKANLSDVATHLMEEPHSEFQSIISLDWSKTIFFRRKDVSAFSIEEHSER